MKKRFKVRFHLARGDNYMKWQVFDLQEGTKTYYDPDTTHIYMRDCKLGNHPKTAQKIYDGENKTVCAWVACEEVTASEKAPSLRNMRHYKYNPKKNPHWHTDTIKNADNLPFKLMVTNKRKVYG